MNIPNLTSPSCVTNLMDYVDGMVASPSPSGDESDAESRHHQLVERWFRDRFFLPRPYKSTTIPIGDDKSYNDIIDDGSSGRSMALFADNLVAKEIRSAIIPVSDDEDEYIGLRPRPQLPIRRHKQVDSNRRRPPGIVMVCTGAPLMPIDQTEDTEMKISTSDEEAEEEALNGCKLFIKRTFSFDDHLPIVHLRRAPSNGSATQYLDEDDRYIEEQPSFTVPVSYRNEGNREKVLYPVSMSR